MISDSYDLKLVDDVVYEADCAMITEGGVTVGWYFFFAPPHSFRKIVDGGQHLFLFNQALIKI
jgi:hypothetical protein